MSMCMSTSMSPCPCPSNKYIICIDSHFHVDVHVHGSLSVSVSMDTDTNMDMDMDILFPTVVSQIWLTFLIFYVLSHLTFCPIRRFFHSPFFLVDVSYCSTFCPSRRFFHSTFCHIRRFVLRRFLRLAFFTLTFCWWTYCTTYTKPRWITLIKSIQIRRFSKWTLLMSEVKYDILYLIPVDTWLHPYWPSNQLGCTPSPLYSTVPVYKLLFISQ